ncbi:MAG TPA: substrate-binding domain-containing protein, partial [Bryobacterales bacterium]|nr:substrate-binding domain-containing protein [Bryobacterales bacterium]
AVIPMGTTHEYWKSIHAGAVKAARELGIDIVWKGPQKEDDRAQQIEVVEDMISRRVDGIVLAPLDGKGLAKPIAEARRAGIASVVVDSGLEGDDYISFIATDNYKGGKLGARRLAEVLGGKGSIILMRVMVGAESTMNREQGFLDEIRNHPGIQILSDNQYGGITTETAYQTGENLLNRFPNVDGIFCPNESTTFGMLRALTDAGKAGKVKFVGFDSSEKLIAALRDKQIQGLVLQNPFRMGELGIETLVRHLRDPHAPVEKRVDTGAAVATPENMETPEIKLLLSPPIEKYLSSGIWNPPIAYAALASAAFGRSSDASPARRGMLETDHGWVWLPPFCAAALPLV